MKKKNYYVKQMTKDEMQMYY